jgi:hypothetical protein
MGQKLKPVSNLLKSLRGINRENWKEVLQDGSEQIKTLALDAAQKLGIEAGETAEMAKNAKYVEEMYFDAKVVHYHGMIFVVPIDTNFIYCEKEEAFPNSLILNASVTDPNTGLLEEGVVRIARIKDLHFENLSDSVKNVSGS